MSPVKTPVSISESNPLVNITWDSSLTFFKKLNLKEDEFEKFKEYCVNLE